jgi:hypothetical protein
MDPTEYVSYIYLMTEAGMGTGKGGKPGSPKDF